MTDSQSHDARDIELTALRKRVEELEGAVAEEREACARIAEAERRNVLAIKYGREPGFHKVGKIIASEIRSRAALARIKEATDAPDKG